MTQSTKRSRATKSEKPTTSSEVSPADVDWNASVEVDLDPVLVERIRARQKLKQITLRVGEEQIAEARRVSRETGIPYQTVLRRWLAEGASLSRSTRKAG